MVAVVLLLTFIMPRQAGASLLPSPGRIQTNGQQLRPHNLATRYITFKGAPDLAGNRIADMAPQRKRDNRENAFFNVGVQGR